MPGLLMDDPAAMPEEQLAPEQVSQGDTLSPTAPGQPSGEAGEGLSAEAEELFEEAFEAVYSQETLPALQEMLREMGPEGFPQAMGMAINAGLDELGDDEPSLEVVAEVGSALFEMLLEDLVETGEVQNLDQDMVVAAGNETIKMWAERNPDKFDPAEFQAAWEQQVNAEEGAPVGGGESAAPRQGMLGGEAAPMPPQGMLEGM